MYTTEQKQAFLDEAKKIEGIVSIRFDATDKQGRINTNYAYSVDVWPACVEATKTGHGDKYDYTKACALQDKKEGEYRKPIAEQLRTLANRLGLKIKLSSHNIIHHDKLSVAGRIAVFNK